MVGGELAVWQRCHQILGNYIIANELEVSCLE